MRKIALRAAVIVLLLAVIGLARVSISRVPTLSVQLATLEGEPLPGAYLAYRYKGYRFNFVDSLTYYRPGEVLRTDAAGRFEIPGFLEFHRPLDSGLQPWIEWVYIPELHHVSGPIGQRSEDRPGVMEIDREHGVFRFADFSEDREGWSRSIRELDLAIRISRTEPGSQPLRYLVTDSVRETLNARLREEFRAFMERHAETPRVAPPPLSRFGLSEEELEARERSMREDLQRYPVWGQLMERRWPQFSDPQGQKTALAE